jgi:hypothetical protein
MANPDWNKSKNNYPSILNHNMCGLIRLYLLATDKDTIPED